MHQYRTQRRIEFADTDMAGIVHFARFFVFMESAEHELLAGLGTPVHFVDEGREMGWPRLAASCRYHSPAYFGDVLDILVRIRRKGRRSLTYGVEFRRQGTFIAEGEISSIFCALTNEDGVRQLEAIPIPARIADQIEEAPAESAEPR
jgi:acyl-CoA thioester hydrolase